MKRKLLSVILAAAMVTAMLAGCGSKEKPEAEAPAETEAPSESGDDAEAPEAEGADGTDGSGMRRPGDGGFRQAEEGSEALPLRGADPPGGAPPEVFPAASPGGGSLLLLAVSGAALLAGLAFAWRFRRRR